MSRDTLIEAMKELIEEWEGDCKRLAEAEDYRLLNVIQDCIDDLKGILPPEE